MHEEEGDEGVVKEQGKDNDPWWEERMKSEQQISVCVKGWS